MGGTALKLAIAAFFVWLSAQMGTFADEILTRVRESVQASELLEIDGFVFYHSGFENERARAPRDQAEFERVVRDWLTAKGGRDVARDRWDEPYVYDRVPARDPRDVIYRIASKGPDRRLGTADDIVVERENDRVTINRDPTKIAEEAIARKERLDRETRARLRELVDKAKPTTSDAQAFGEKDVSREQVARELDGALRELGRMLEGG